MRRVLFIAIILNFAFSKEQIYSYEALLNHTLANSPNAQISKLNIEEAKAEYDYALSNFYPTIYLGANTEYSKRFDDNYNSVYIGESSLSSDTAYQNSLSLGLRYDLFKFGSDYYNAKSAKTHIATTTLQNCHNNLDISLNLLEIYHQALNLKNQIEANKELKGVYEILTNYATRLNNAGQMDKIDANEYSLKLSQIKARILNLQDEANFALNEISKISNLNIKSLNSLIEFQTEQEVQNLKFIDFNDTFIAKALKSELDENALALKSLQRAKYPTISLYAKYDFYGSDYKAHKDTDPHGYRVGLSINYEIFDGGRKNAQIKKQEIMNKKLQFQRQNEELKFQKEQRDIMSFLELKDTMQKTLTALNNETKRTQGFIARLNSAGEKSKLEVINSLIATIEAKSELQAHILKSNFTLKKLGLIAEQSKKCE